VGDRDVGQWFTTIDAGEWRGEQEATEDQSQEDEWEQGREDTWEPERLPG